MILPFSITLNDKPTLFPEKIWQSFDDDFTIEHFDKYVLGFGEIGYEFNIDAIDLLPKGHTIRIDKNNRWKAGVMIDFFINNRKPNMFRFAPRIPCKGTQHIFMSYLNELEISIDGRQLAHAEIDCLYKNDGFSNYGDFEEYFLQAMDEENEFSGKIIHWTDFRY